MSNTVYTDDRSGSQWTRDELTLIESLARRRNPRKRLLAMFPGRTLAAIKKQIHTERIRLGIAKTLPDAMKRPDDAFTMLDPDDPGERCDWPERWAHKAALANNAFLAALQMAA